MTGRTMSGPPTRVNGTNVIEASDAFMATSSEEPDSPFGESVDALGGVYTATLDISPESGANVGMTLTVRASARMVDLILHAASDAFREEVER